jgi:hypothetical protein
VWIIAGPQSGGQGPEGVFLIEVCDFALNETDRHFSASQNVSGTVINSMNDG